MRHSPTSAGFLQCNGGKLEEAEDLQCVRRLLCVRALVRELLSNKPLFVGQL